MTVQQQLMQQALDEMKQASITPEVWCKKIDDIESYAYKNTHTYKALQLLFKAANTPVNPNPPAQDLSDVQRCLFLTDDTSRALQTRNRLLIATADLNYRHFYSTSFLQQAIVEDRLRVWCDCHTTFPETAHAWLRDLGLPPGYFYGECESKKAFQVAYEGGARKMIGNLSVLTSDDSLQPNAETNQLGLVKAGMVHVTNETYFNKDPDQLVDWRKANAGVGSNTVAVYESETEGANYFALQDQAAQGKYNAQIDCVYVAGMRSGDWDYLVAN